MCNSFHFRPTAVAVAAAIASAASAYAQAQPAADNAGDEEEIVVTGVPRDSAPVDIAQSVSVLRGDVLDRVRAATLGETLASEVGVSSSAFGAGASRPIVRGLAGARVRTLEDGIDSMDAAAVSDDHAVAVDALVADQIEIFRGPTTLLYGSGAVGGVINTVTSRIPESVPETLDGAAELRADSVSDGRSVGLRLDGGAGRLAWHFDALARDSDDYKIPGFAEHEHEEGEDAEEEHEEIPGIVENSAAESDAAAAGVSWVGRESVFGVSVSTYSTLYGVPGHHHHEEASEEEAEAEEAVRVDLEQTRVDLKGEWAGLGGGIEQVNLRVGINDYEHAELEGEAVGTRFTNDASEVRVELLHRPLGEWNGAFGMQVADREFAALGEEAFLPQVGTSSFGLFVLEEREIGRWQVALGGRIETQEHDPVDALAGPPVDGDATNVSFAAVRELTNGRSFVANFAIAQRLPVAEELYSSADVPHLATRMFQLGDATLHEETARHVDLGLRGSRDDVHWGVTGFLTDYDDFIFLADTGAVVDELPVFAFVQGNAQLTGLEAEFFAPIAEIAGGELDVRVFGDWVNARLDNGDNLPRIPPARVGARFQYHDTRLMVGIEATRHSEQDETAPFEDATEGYTMVDADFLWRIPASGSSSLEVVVNARNLGDVEARKHTSFVKDVAPLPGRNYAVGVRARW